MRNVSAIVFMLFFAACSAPHGDSRSTDDGGNQFMFPDLNDPKFFPQCRVSSDDPAADVIDAPTLKAAYAGLRADAGNGSILVNLSPKGCYFLTRTIEQGQVHTTQYFHRSGEVTLVVDGGSIAWVPATKVFAHWTRDPADGTVHGETDIGEKGYPSWTTDEKFTGDQVSEVDYQTVASTSTATNLIPSSKQTIVQTGSGVYHVKLEHFISGAWETEEEHDFTSIQAGSGCPCCTAGPDVAVGCTEAQVNASVEKLLEGLSEGSACLGKLFNSVAHTQALWAIERALRHGYFASCHTGSQTAASVNFSQLDHGRILLDVNVEALSCASDSFIKSTFFHEALHGIFGGHDPYSEVLPDNLSAYTYSDRIRSCEALCFDQGNRSRVGGSGWSRSVPRMGAIRSRNVERLAGLACKASA